MITSYQFIGQIGEGKDEKIIRAVGLIEKKEVSIKFSKLKKTDKYKECLVEGLILHKAFPEYYETKFSNGLNIQVYEYIKGQALSQNILERKESESSNIINIMVQMLDVLNYLPQHRISIRAINPSNVIIAANDSIF